MNREQQLANLARGQAGDADLSSSSHARTLEELRDAFTRLRENISLVVVGKDDVIKLVLAAMVSRGHILLEDIPGVGKTTLAKSIAKSIDASFSRIQFTPDLLPSDITGSTIYSPRDERFYWSEGPLFANIVLADEINRTSPRTQSALLEAMEENQVTVEHETHPLPSPFFIIATQNPHELHGTFPLPEGQIDRFMATVSIGLPGRSSEEKLIRDQIVVHPLEQLKPVIDRHQIIQLQTAVRQVKVADNILNYVLDIVQATRAHEQVSMGASPRASVALVHICQSLAFINDRAYVTPDDIQAAVMPVLAHRLVLRNRSSGKTDRAGIVADILSSRRVPV